jgi:hypothetical protein
MKSLKRSKKEAHQLVCTRRGRVSARQTLPSHQNTEATILAISNGFVQTVYFAKKTHTKNIKEQKNVEADHKPFQLKLNAISISFS